MDTRYARCAALIERANALLVTAGAGMGIDSGLPDFRGPGGFWRAYPALGRARMAFEEIANPAAFAARPRMAWGFYGHRLNMYRQTVPHEGFRLLREIGARLPGGVFVFTSNVDGQFQKAGFAADRIVECHGSIHHLQCFDACHEAIWPASGFMPEVDAAECLLTSDLPRCPRCGAIARPNILMFGDWGWLSEQTEAQQQRLRAWLQAVGSPLVIEIGAGSNIPTVRRFGERVAAALIRINPSEPQRPPGEGVSLAVGGLPALRAIAACLR